MAAETLTSYQAASAVSPGKNSLSGVVHSSVGKYSILVAALEDGDIFKMCKVPAGSLVIGAEMHIADLDTGTEAVDIDLGWADNGGGSETITLADGTTYTNMYDGSAAPAGLVDAGVLTGDVITDVQAAGLNSRRACLVNGPIYFSRETTIQLEVNVAQATPQAGGAFVRVDYLVIG